MNNKRTYIIAEAGVNHNGQLDLAIELIKKAKQVGADCVKFQTFKAEQIVTMSSPKAKYQLEVTSKSESQYEMLKKLELKPSNYDQLLECCKVEGIDFLSTPYNKEDADFLEKVGVNAFKVASGQLTELPFLKYLARKMKTMIVSTGMSTLADVYNAVECIRAEGNNDIIVLQCTTNYPSRIEDVNLLAMTAIRDSCKVRVGYSDHVTNNYACFASVALGAEVVEKHFTLDKSLEGPDHSSSLVPEEFAELIQGIRNVELALGDGIKKPSHAERLNSFGMRRSLVALEDLPAGTILKEEHLGFKRPSNGLSPNHLEVVVGLELAKDVRKDEALQFGSIRWHTSNE